MTFHCSQTNKLEAVKKCASAVESRGVGQKPFALSTNVTKVSWNMQASTWREHIHKVPTCLRSEEALWSTHSFEQNQDLARIFCAALPPPPNRERHGKGARHFRESLATKAVLKKDTRNFKENSRHPSWSPSLAVPNTCTNPPPQTSSAETELGTWMVHFVSIYTCCPYMPLCTLNHQNHQKIKSGERTWALPVFALATAFQANKQIAASIRRIEFHRTQCTIGVSSQIHHSRVDSLPYPAQGSVK